MLERLHTGYIPERGITQLYVWRLQPVLGRRIAGLRPPEAQPLSALFSLTGR